MSPDALAGPPVRAFAAIRLGALGVAELARCQRSLENEVGPGAVQWTRPDQIHLTLKFYGNVLRIQIPDLARAIQQACAGQRCFGLAWHEFGVFPSRARPRVLWVGLTGQIDQLRTLQRSIDQRTAGFGDHHETRPFQPHLTLGRIRTSPGTARQAVEVLERAPRLEGMPWEVREIDLMQSRLRPTGAEHECLATARLMVETTLDRCPTGH